MNKQEDFNQKMIIRIEIRLINDKRQAKYMKFWPPEEDTAPEPTIEHLRGRISPKFAWRRDRAIASMLTEGYTYRKIKRQLRVSSTTISKVAKSLRPKAMNK